MIHLKLKIFDNESENTFPIIDGESIQEVYDRILPSVPIENPKEALRIYVNGDLQGDWETKIKEGDHVIITPNIGGKDSNNFLRVAMIIGLAMAAPWAAGAIGLTAPWAVAGFTAVVSTLGAMWSSSIFPPPSPEVGTSAPVERSQMYTIEGQSNQVARMSLVPKVYGTHRFFPRVAANPYVSLESKDGKQVQYMYGIYDFGLGPANISDIRIGNTPIEEFSDVDYRLVDFNRPDVSEGPWDDALNKELKYYKGDVTSEALGIVLEKNANDNPTPNPDYYTATRSAAPNTRGESSEITVTVVAPQGLQSYNSKGDQGSVRVNLELMFAEEGTEDWKAFNDLDHVEDFRSQGGDYGTSDSNVSGAGDHSYLVFRNEKLVSTVSNPKAKNGEIQITRNFTREVCLIAGSTHINLYPPAGGINERSVIRFGGEVVGIVESVETISPTNIKVNFREPTEKDFVVHLQRGKQEYLRGLTSSTWLPKVWDAFTINYVRGIPINSRVALSGNGSNSDAIYATFTFIPINKQASYKVRLTRISTSSKYSHEVRSSVTWTELRTRFNSNPIDTDKRHVFLELRILGTNQLRGTIQNLSATVSSVLDVHDNGQWIKKETDNPAWVFVDLLTGEVNKRAVPKSRLDMTTILEWAAFCDEIPPHINDQWSFKRFGINFVLDFQTTLQSLVERVTSVGQASMNIIDGKYGVLIDRKKTTPTQIITPRNSFNFSGSRNFFTPPHAMEIQFIDPSKNWEMSSVKVFQDGYDENNYETIEEAPTFGITNMEQAWRYGRYLMAQAKYRPETITVDMDIEHTICERGDYVQFAHDAMAAGGVAARVKTVDPATNEITIDDIINLPVTDWGYQLRTRTGHIYMGRCTPAGGFKWELEGTLPSEGDQIVIGQRTRVVLDCIVKAKTPKEDFAATLVLVEKNDLIHDSEIGGELPAYDPNLSPIRDINYAPAAVEDLAVADNAWECSGEGYLHYITLVWEPPTNNAFEFYKIFLSIDGAGYIDIATVRNAIYTFVVDNDNLDREHTFKVAAVSGDGKMLELPSLTTVSATPLKKITPPSSVQDISLNITGEVLEIKWEPVPDCDVAEYLVRFSPTMAGSWEASTFVQRVSRNTNAASVQARVGTYLVKAIDYNGNESENAISAVTTIPELFGLNLLQTVTDPDFSGSKNQVVKQDGYLRLAKRQEGGADVVEYFEDGYYYYKTIVDLGDVYTVRINSYIRAEGFSDSDIIASWIPLASATPLSSARVSDWDVVAEYRVSKERNVIADWEKLSDIPAMSSGIEPFYSEWRPFTAGDITGRVIQFRLRLRSFRADVTPRVFEGKIIVDVPDRERRFDNILAPAEGIELFYAPDFKGPQAGPNIQVTIENSQPGDNWEITDRTLTSFKIRFFDASGTPVARRFDAVARGYGYKYTDII